LLEESLFLAFTVVFFLLTQAMIATTRTALVIALLALGFHPAVAQLSTNGSNTIVRFHFYRGATTLGDVDVELFDTDKPVTVSNFLHYVRSGAYDNLMLHRCEQGFVIQGGAVRTPNPLSTAYFNAYLETPKFGPITNEFGVGPQLSNTFGTLAMARAVGDPFTADLGTNSAQADWFFNLADNSSTLDTNYGGFTVFGRALAGTNVLDFFNHNSPTLDVLQIGGPYFYQVPVAYTNHHYPRFSEIYHVRITDLGVTNTTRPTITLTAPATNIRTTNASLTVMGTAADDEQVSSLWYRHSYYDWDNSIGLVTGEEINVPGSNVWSLPIHLVPGTNYISVQSVDNSGLRSAATLLRQVHYSVLHPIGLTNVGNGRIAGATNQQRIEIGKFVNLTAVPAPNHMFYGWSGRYLWEPTRLPPVPMHSNLLLTATYVTNPFPPLKGSYAGLFFNPLLMTNFAVSNTAHITSGSITFSVSDYGKVSGKLRIGVKTHAFSGAFSPRGFFSKTISRTGDDPLVVNLVLDVTNRSDYVTGDVRDPIPGLNGFFWLSEVHGYRVRPGTTTAPSAFAGRHTFMIPGTNNGAQPFGDSWGTATINYAGKISASGALADNTPFSFSGPVLTNGQLPFYTGHNGGHSTLFGWVQFDYSGTNDDFNGLMHWIKRAPNLGKPYPNGFQNYYPILAGSRYTPATSTNQVLGFSNAVVILSGGHLSPPSTNDVFIRTNNTALNLDTNKLTFAIVKPSGQFVGTVTPVNNAKSIPFKGTLLKRQDRGAGFFVSTNVTGQVYFGP
jgi:cyclophilin family peptidyl-prolyl cis-trans isomerase